MSFLTDSYDNPQPILLDQNWLNNFNPLAAGQSVIENVFGDTRTFDPTTNTWNMSQAQASQNAYDRFASLNPPAVLPKFPSLSGLTSGLMGSLLVIVLGLIVLLKIIK